MGLEFLSTPIGGWERVCYLPLLLEGSILLQPEKLKGKNIRTWAIYKPSELERALPGGTLAGPCPVPVSQPRAGGSSPFGGKAYQGAPVDLN